MEREAPVPDGSEGAIDAPVCLHCCGPCEPGTTVCEYCGGPVSGYVMSLPFEGTVQEARLLGRAGLLSSPSLLVVLGLWIIVGLGLCGFAAGFSGEPSPLARTFLMVVDGLVEVLVGIAAVRATRHGRATHRRAAPPEAPAAV